MSATKKTDIESLVSAAQSGSGEAINALVHAMRPTVEMIAMKYIHSPLEKDDLVQEGMIGLYKAIRDYKADKQTSFRAFAELCVKRQIITAIKTATRQKHVPLNSYVSLNKPLYDEESDRTLMDVIEGRVTNPEDLFISQEEVNHIHEQIDVLLSDLEKQVLEAFMDGKSYQEIAVMLDRHVKSIDNALQRVKRKLMHFRDEKRNDE